MQKNRTRKEFWDRYASRKHQKELKRRRKKSFSGVFNLPKRRSRVVKEVLSKSSGRKVGSLDSATGIWELKIPKVFSILDNPEASLDVIYTLGKIARAPHINGVSFDHSKCEKMDLCASVLLDVVALGVEKEWESRDQPGEFEGTFPTDEKVKRLLRCTGLLKSLGFNVPAEESKEFVILPLIRGCKKLSKLNRGGAEQDMAVSKLISYFDQCFQVAGYELSKEGKRQFGEWAGEIITNAEEHSGTGNWWAIAYMDKSSSDVDGECQLAIFSFGTSIYESLKTSHAGTDQIESITRLTERHQKRKSFGVFGDFKYSDADLWTLYALQEGVSRHKGTEEGIDRGTGTAAMIDAFQKLGDSEKNEQNPKMTVISGNTQIIFDEKYSMKFAKTSEGQLQQIIAFNESNNLEEPPDKNNVRGLRNYFPGTLIAFKFFIDRVYLERQRGESNGQGENN